MKFKCERCSYETDKINHLKRHLSRKIICDDLNECGKSQCDLLKSLDKDTTDYEFKCTLCNLKFKTNSGKYKHEFKCKLEKQEIELKQKELENKQLKESLEKKELENLTFKNEIKDIILLSKVFTDYKCTICDEKFKTNSERYKHEINCKLLKENEMKHIILLNKDCKDYKYTICNEKVKTDYERYKHQMNCKLCKQKIEEILEKKEVEPIVKDIPDAPDLKDLNKFDNIGTSVVSIQKNISNTFTKLLNNIRNIKI